jgi:hypothetical protein
LARPYSEFIHHACGYLLSFHNLIRTVKLDADEFFMLRMMGLAIFQFVVYALEHDRSSQNWGILLQDAFKFNQLASILSVAQDGRVRGQLSKAMEEEDERARAQVMMYSLQIYLYYYANLYKLGRQGEVSLGTVCLNIRHLVQEISATVYQQSRFRKMLDSVRGVARSINTDSSDAQRSQFFIHPAYSSILLSYLSMIVLKNLFFRDPSDANNIDNATEAALDICDVAVVVLEMVGDAPSKFNPWPVILSLCVAQRALAKSDSTMREKSLVSSAHVLDNSRAIKMLSKVFVASSVCYPWLKTKITSIQPIADLIDRASSTSSFNDLLQLRIDGTSLLEYFTLIPLQSVLAYWYLECLGFSGFGKWESRSQGY